MRAPAVLLLSLSACSSVVVTAEVVVIGTGEGSAGFQGGPSCSVGERCTTELTSVNLRASPGNADTTFHGWAGPQCSGLDSCQLTWRSARVRQFALFGTAGSLVVAPDGPGTGIIEGPGLSCGAGVLRCSLTRPAGPVELRATPHPESVFSGWSGACSGTGACVVEPDGSAQWVTAQFAPLYPLTVSVTGAGRVLIHAGQEEQVCRTTCTVRVVANTTVELVAEPDSHRSSFGTWSGATVSTSRRVLSLAVERPTVVGASFFEIEALTISTGVSQLSVPGSAYLSVRGGVQPYSLSASSGRIDGAVLFVTEPGPVTVTATDQVGNTATTTLVAANPITSNLTIEPASASVRAGEVVRFKLLGGSAPFSFTTTEGTITDQGVFTAPLVAGTAVITANDGVGGRATAFVEVGAAFTRTTSVPLRAPGPVATGELDRDGRRDAVFLDATGLQRFAFDATGMLVGAYTLAALPDAGALAMSDWNHDALPDVFVSDGRSQLTLFLNAGDGGFTEERRIALRQPSEQLVAADLDADGQPELVSRANGRIAVVHTVDAGLELLADVTQLDDAAEFSVTDVNRDGLGDLLVRRGDHLELRRGLGAGLFEAAVPIAPSTSLQRFVVGDFTCDGWPDVLVAHDLSLTLLMNDHGVLTPARGTQVLETSVDALSTMNWNFDSCADALVATGDRVMLLVAKPDGTFWPGAWSPGLQGAQLVAGDWGGTRRDDLLVIGPTGVLQLANSYVFWTDFDHDPAVRFASPASTHLVSADWNRDGRSDLAWLTNAGVGVGLAPAFTPLPGLHPGANSLAVCDWNRDSTPDLAITSSTGLAIYLGAGDGTFTAGPGIASTGPLVGVALGEWNRDGRLDLAVIDSVSGEVRLFAQTADGALVVFGTAPARGARVIASADLDGDGADELLCAEADTDGVGAWDTAGVGVFRAAGGVFVRHSGFLLNGVRALIASDTNLDGRVDLTMASAFGLYQARGLGAGRFTPPAQLSGTRSVGALARANVVPAKLETFWWVSDDGTIGLANGPPFTQRGNTVDAFATGDFDADGREDLAAISQATGLSIWLRR